MKEGTTAMSEGETRWLRVLGTGELPEGRVRTVVAGRKALALTHFEGEYSALTNKCPRQGGPLGEGTIENGWLRCPWHGYDYHPTTGEPPEGFRDCAQAFPVEVREDGIYVELPAEVAEARTVSDVLVETMVNWGVRHVFGMVGHSNLGFADAMRRQEEQGNLTYIGVRHEGAAAFAASAYGKLTGRPAACFAIAGPGATNLQTGLWDAKVDRAPLLALTGQVDTQALGPGALQEVDLAAAFAPVAAWSQTVLPGSRHAELMSLALKHAIQRRDVTYLILPDEVQVQAAPDSAAGTPEGRTGSTAINPPDDAVAAAMELIEEADRPVIVVGHGAGGAMDAVTVLAERLGAPVLTTFKGKGLISDGHPLGCGVLGRSGTPVASWFMNESDLLLVFGASFSNHTGIAAYKPIVQVDFDRSALGKFHAVDVPVWGDVAVTARRLLGEIGAEREWADRRRQVAARWELWREEKRNRERDDSGAGLNSAAVFAAMNRTVPEDAVLAVDVGNNTYSFGRYFECAAQSVLMSGYLGSIGFALPAAMGAWAAAPERKIVAVAGDGGFGQYMGELTTAVKYGMDITLVLINNGELGKISKEQRAAEMAVWQTSLHNPNFAEFAKLCGAWGRRVTEKDELEGAIRAGLAHRGMALIEVMGDVDLV